MITIQDVKNYVLTDIAEGFEPQVTSWIAQTSKFIESFTNNEFGLQDNATERVFDGNNKRELLVDGFYELESVEVNGNELTVFAYPANRTPKYKLQSDARFAHGRQNVIVTAKWGYGEVPEDIKFACLVLTAGIIQKQTKPDLQSEKIGDYQVSFMTEQQRDDYNRAMQTLKMYQSIAI
jgi:hypothetical protein